jgi:hypothetical protein
MFLLTDDMFWVEHCSVGLFHKCYSQDSSMMNVEGSHCKLQSFFIVDLTRIDGKGEFRCPRCGTEISPDDKKEKNYTLLEAKMKGDYLDGVRLQCNKCQSQIYLTGFSLLNK